MSDRGVDFAILWLAVPEALSRHKIARRLALTHFETPNVMKMGGTQGDDRYF
jgi:hypothetical protein